MTNLTLAAASRQHKLPVDRWVIDSIMSSTQLLLSFRKVFWAEGPAPSDRGQPMYLRGGVHLVCHLDANSTRL